MTNVWSILGGVITGLLIMIGLVYLVIKALKPSSDEKSKEKTPATEEDKAGGKLSWVKHPAFLITLGLIVFNLISWAMIPWWWSILIHTWYHFVFFNLGFWLVLYLGTIKTKGEDGKDTKESNPTASKMASIIALVLVLGLATTAWQQIQVKLDKSKAESGILSRTSTTNLSHGVPMEIALRVIAECESGTKQFGTDGKPIKNMERSGAFGKYQFLESHREPAKKLGFDLDTEEGQEKYARYRYGISQTKDWEADPRSSACWEPKLRAYTWGGGEAVVIVVLAPVDKMTDPPIPTPYAPKKWELNGFGKKYKVLWNREVEEDLPRAKGAESKQPTIVYDFQLQSREREAAPITVKFF